MDRTRFLRNIFSFGLLSAFGCQMGNTKNGSSENKEGAKSVSDDDAIKKLKEELITAWNRSEMMTMTNVEQMPKDYFTFKYTDEALPFSEQWRHCIIFTCGQLAGRAEIENPYENVKLPVQMSKMEVIRELKNMYSFVRTSILELSESRLLSDCEFVGDTIPVWRLFYAMENHIIHHRGQCIVYLRLKGVIPKGFYGW